MAYGQYCAFFFNDGTIVLLLLSELFMETRRLKADLMKAVESGSKKQMILFRQLQECLLQVREVGNTKLEISARMLDTVCIYIYMYIHCMYMLYVIQYSIPGLIKYCHL